MVRRFARHPILPASAFYGLIVGCLADAGYFVIFCLS